jgi:hypothetical protein
MDFWAFTKKLAGFADKAVDVSSGAFTKAGEITGNLLEKTADFSYDKLKTSPLTITDGNMLDETIALKSCVIFVVGSREDAGSKSIIGRMPLLVGKAWQYSTTLKILYAEDLPAQVSALGASIPSVLIYKKGAQKYHLTGAELTEFIESFDITKEWGVTTAPTLVTTPVETVASENPPSTDR